MRLPPYLTCGLALAAALAASVFVGAEPIAPGEILTLLLGSGTGVEPWKRAALLDIRLPNAVLIALVGATLGGSGAAYQGLLRNPLADPYLIGVAPGAALGAVAAMVFLGSGGILGFAAVPAAAFLGALAAVGAVYRIARVGRTTPTTTLILAGVAVGAFTSALTWCLMLQAKANVAAAVVFMLGGFRQGTGWAPVLGALPYMATGLAALVLLGRPLNVLQFGDEQALQLGLPVERVKALLVLAASLAAAAAVAAAGIIGFVGLIVPHMARLLWGADYRRLLPLSILGGSATLLAADCIVRALPGLPGLHLGVVTGLLGVPFFLYLLRRERPGYW